MTVKHDVWFPEKEFKIIKKVCERIKTDVQRIGFARELCVEEYMEDANGISAHEILELIRKFLKDGHKEVDTYIFLNLLAYYPKSMTCHNLTPLMQTLIPFTYYYSQNSKEAPKLSMEDLSEWFGRSKATIYHAVQKRQDAENMIKTALEEEKLRKKARKEAYQRLVEEEKLKLKLERANNRKMLKTTEQTIPLL